jgi:hypothetical protein
MRFTRIFAVGLVLALCVAPIATPTDKDKSDCEQVANPALKAAACTRILSAANLTKDIQAFAHHHRGLGLLGHGDFFFAQK